MYYGISITDAGTAEMNRIRLALLVAACLGIAGQAVVAKEIYTWTDENGIVHYVDTPPDHPDAKAIDAPEAYRPGSVSAEVPAATSPEAAADPALSAADARRLRLADARTKQEAEQQQIAAICAEARRRLAEVEPSRRVFYENEQGETVRMGDEERVRLVEQYKALIEQNCD